MSNITNQKSVSYTRVWPLQVSLKVNVMKFILPCFVAIIKVLLSTGDMRNHKTKRSTYMYY
ncbi:hypothetical protein NC653_040106 [Populus alba x Populus x berolinensis]|nr:hypothetical protein NC653_040106 [Populus alba x Populus x berolinensis]